MKIDILHDVFERNREQAATTRRRFDEHGIVAFNLMGSPGCGKTALLEALLPRLNPHLRCAVLEGDPATFLDAERIAATGTHAVQLITDGCCHLEPNFVYNALDKLDLDQLDAVFIENVGNLVCPANFKLGEHRRIVMLSVTEGTDKAAKYPGMFAGADLVVVNKIDLLEHCDFDVNAATQYIRRVNETAPVLSVCGRNGNSVDAVAEWIRAQKPNARPATSDR